MTRRVHAEGHRVAGNAPHAIDCAMLHKPIPTAIASAGFVLVEKSSLLLSKPERRVVPQ